MGRRYGSHTYEFKKRYYDIGEISVNKAIILGRLGQDPELKHTSTGIAVANFTVATSESWTDKSGKKQDKTEWHRITAWGKTAELCAKYLSKGRQVLVEGSIETRSWEDKDGQKRYTTEVKARNVQFLGGGEKREERREEVITTDDLPF